MKRTLLGLVLLLSLTMSYTLSHAQEKTKIRIGYQRADLSILIIEQGTLQDALGDAYEIEWTLFPAGPQLLEALNAGSIDFGATGNVPPIFAQAADVPLVYAATQVSSSGQAIIVPADSDIQTLADLEGKKVAWTSGSSAHYLAVQAAEAGGFTLDDIEEVSLLPTDALAAFQGGSIDAWAIWEPFLSITALTTGGRIIEGSESLTEPRSFYLASAAFAEEHPDVLDIILQQIQGATEYVRDNITEYSEILAEQTGVPVEIWQTIYENREAQDLEPLTEDVVIGQQAIADTFYELGLLPEPIDVSTAIWVWESAEAE